MKTKTGGLDLHSLIPSVKIIPIYGQKWPKSIP